jgi:hypothetical protein
MTIKNMDFLMRAAFLSSFEEALTVFLRDSGFRNATEVNVGIR